MHGGTRWRAEADGRLAAEVEGLRLVVRGPTEVDGFARFMLLSRISRGGGPFALTASGTSESVLQAMEAAERRAVSCTHARSAATRAG